MKRLIITAGGTVAVLALAACGGTSASTNNAAASTPKSSTGTTNPAAAAARRGASGELVQINGTSLILNTTTGDVTVGYTATTPITQTSTGVLADITPGSCLSVSGTKSGGTLVATTVRLSQPVKGSCSAGFGGTRGTGTRPAGLPTPSGTPRPRPTLAPGQTPPAFAIGKVTAVNGTAVTIQPATGAAQTVTVPTTVTVTESNTVPASSLATGDCVSAQGAKDSSGNVTTATSLSIVPAGPSGCFTGGSGFGGGGFGGGRFGGGGGGGFGGGGAA